MSDLRLVWNVTAADLRLSGNDIVLEDGLETSVMLSLFTNRRALESDDLPGGQSDRQGWWADEYAAADGDRHGSRLWLLGREKELPAVLRRAEEYASESLQWLIEDRIAASFDVVASIPRKGVLGLSIGIDRPMSGRVEFFHEYVWAAQEAQH
jgi:phage gp46-like protein